MGELETQLSWVRDMQGGKVQGSNQLASAVDSKLIQNSKRSGKKGEMIKGIYTSMQELIAGGAVGKNRQENIIIQKKSTYVDQKWKVLIRRLKGE